MNKLYKFVNGKRVAVLKPIKCPVCENDFQPQASSRKYCSRECYYKMKKIRGDGVKWTDEMRGRVSRKMSGKNNPNYGKPSPMRGKKRPEMWGSNHPLYKGGYTNKIGYREIMVGGERYLEHRYVMEQEIGRKLTEEEIVHHINGDKLDNRLENLQITNRADHIEMHRKEQ
jgi:hypothetical protein